MSGFTVFDFDASCRWLPCLSEGRRVDLTGLSGVCRYCDSGGRNVLEGCAEEVGCRGVHWIGSGHYHYLTLLFLQQIQEPFALAVADLHTDMQEAPFEGVLSCGGWLKEALRTCPALKTVLLVGVDEELVREAPLRAFPAVHVIPRSEAAEGRVGEWLRPLPEGCPVYVSVDKDVLLPHEAVTDWGNGSLRTDFLLAWLEQLAARHPLLGADLCGDTARQEACLQGAAAVNNSSTARILSALLRLIPPAHAPEPASQNA